MPWLPPVVALLSVVACGLYLLLARRLQLLDIPDERSSHELPTPHGGGVGIILAFSFGMLIAWGQWPGSGQQRCR